jgi:hypothetical protein
MPLTNQDSSDLTRKRAAKTLYGWYSGNRVASLANGVRREQPNTQTLDVTTRRQQGACLCANQGVYDFVGCGCGGGN